MRTHVHSHYQMPETLKRIEYSVYNNSLKKQTEKNRINISCNFIPCSLTYIMNVKSKPN